MPRLLTRFATSTSALLCAMGLIAGDAAAKPLVEMTVADGQRLVRNWEASIYGRVWNDPALASLRAKLDGHLAKLVEEGGVDPIAVLKAMKSARLRVLAAPAGAKDAEPLLHIQADLGSTVESVFATLRKAHQPSAGATSSKADEMLETDEGKIVFARFGTVLVIGSRSGIDLAPQAVAPGAHDVQFTMNGPGVLRAIEAHEPGDPDTQAFTPLLSKFLLPMAGHADLLPDGVASTLTVEGTFPWLVPADLSLFNRLPANTISASLIGIDGKIFWQTMRADLLSAIAATNAKNGRGPTTPETVEAKENARMAKAGAPTTTAELIEGLTGTLVYSMSPGSPMPGVTVGLPRSTAVDAYVAFLNKMVSADLPAEGASTMIPIPHVPLPLHLVRGKDHWLATSDAGIAMSWSEPAGEGFADTAAAKLAVSKAGKAPLLISASDTSAELRMYAGYAGMGLAAVPGLEPRDKQGILQGLNKLAALSRPSWANVRQEGGRLVAEGQGLTSNVGLMAIIAAIAIPNLLESRVAANETASRATLKSGIFPAQVQFQAGGYQDLDQDNIGEYGLLSELGGQVATNKTDAGKITLLGGPLAMGNTSSGYRFAIYLPDDKGGAIGETMDENGQITPAKRIPIAGDVNDQERSFVAYAWPISPDSGRRVFALTSDGQVRSRVGGWRRTDQPPAWNDVFGGKGWSDPATWPVHTR